MPQEEGGWFLLFSLAMVLGGWGPGLGHNIHSFPASGPGPLGAYRLQSALSLWACSSNHPGGEPATAPKFLTKQLPTVVKNRTAFHTAQLSNQSGDYLGQGLTRPKASPFDHGFRGQ